MSPPGKEQRPDHIAIGRHHHAAGRHIERGLVVALVEQRVVERLAEDLVDQLRRRPAAGAVGEIDEAVPDIQLAGAQPGRSSRRRP
jgi:hypothetical protein